MKKLWKKDSLFFDKDKITKPEFIQTEREILTPDPKRKSQILKANIYYTDPKPNSYRRKLFASKNCWFQEPLVPEYDINFSRLTHGEFFIVESEGLLETEHGEIVQIRGRVHQLTGFGVKQYRRGSCKIVKIIEIT